MIDETHPDDPGPTEHGTSTRRLVVTRGSQVKAKKLVWWEPGLILQNRPLVPPDRRAAGGVGAKGGGVVEEDVQGEEPAQGIAVEGVVVLADGVGGGQGVPEAVSAELDLSALALSSVLPLQVSPW